MRWRVSSVTERSLRGTQKSDKIDAARIRRGLNVDDAGADINEIRNALAAGPEPSGGHASVGGTHAGDVKVADFAHCGEYVPSMPVIPAAIEGEDGHWETLAGVVAKHRDTELPPLTSMVAKSIPLREAKNIPNARAALQSEWTKL